MREVLAVRVPGDPVGKGRPRASRQGRVYTPGKTRAWERDAADLIGARWHGLEPLDEPVAVTVRAVKARPKRITAPGRQLRTTKPDLDNVIKAAIDALEKGGAVVNDTRVAILHRCMSLYAAEDEGPCVEVIVYTLGG